ncbi:MAG: hypothetical protein K0Q48_2755 [Bacillota bacterium]|nr:hypothetical protein [Bacillota bacterium]
MKILFVQLQDPKYQIFVPVRSYGQFGIQIVNSKKFLTKLVGTMPVLDKEAIQGFFRGLYLTKVKDTISSYLVQEKISILFGRTVGKSERKDGADSERLWH